MAGGEVDGVVVTFFDITKVVEGEVLESLVDELNHRVRNMLMVVSAVASSTLRHSSNPEEFARIFKGRVNALATAHELVTRGGWRAVSLVDLIEKELTPYTIGVDRLVIHGQPVLLKPRAAISLGMVLHEMATNATKYGALSTETGRISITWASEEVDHVPCLVIRWSESGGPRITAVPERRGFGTELIERLLRHDLKATLDVSFDHAGLRITIALPGDVVVDRGDLALDPLANRGRR
jgi:two-component system CheB/CheR fusion protein